MSRQNSITFTTVLIITMIVLLPPSVVAQDDDRRFLRGTGRTNLAEALVGEAALGPDVAETNQGQRLSLDVDNLPAVLQEGYLSILQHGLHFF